MRLNIAVVIPWFGSELKGGAEQHAWQIASRLSQRGHAISVLTTCSESFLGSWDEDFYSPGIETIEGMEVHRFSVSKRDSNAFDQANSKLMSVEKSLLLPGLSPCSSDEERNYLDNNIFSRDLDGFIEKEQARFDYFIFLPYLFPNILYGIEHVADKAILQPCLHDESYAYLPAVARAFQQARYLVFNSEGEQALAGQIIGPEVFDKGIVAHAGVEIDSRLLVSDSAQLVEGPYLLCLGRRDATKNTTVLIEVFLEFLRRVPESELKLVVAGPGVENLSIDGKVIDLELVSEADKLALLKNCAALINPSENESFSRVIFEAWLCSRPVIVNQACTATYLALRSSGDAGYSFTTNESLVDLIAKLSSTSSETLESLGARGRDYARKVADWQQVISRYELLMSTKSAAQLHDKSIHQLLPNLSYGDAISQHAMFIRDFLRARGYQSEILVRYIDPRMQSECKLYKPELLNNDDGLIYHHSIGFEHTQVAVEHEGKKALVYHNITPEDFFRPFDKVAADRLKVGRQELPAIVSSFDHVFGDSQFNCRELELLGASQASVLKIPMNILKSDCISDSTIAEELSDGSINVLFVGRIAPNKKQTDLVNLLAHLLRIDAGYRLVLCGGAGDGDRYAQSLYKLIEELGLEKNVLILDHVTDSQLKAAYLHSSAFVSMSEHEGVGIPLLEAMWFELPVFAYRSSAVPETLGSAAVMLKDKRNMALFACTIDEVLKDTHLRSLLLEAQRNRRRDFLAEHLTDAYESLVSVLS